MESNQDVKNRRRPGEPQIVVVGMRHLGNVAGVSSHAVGASIALVLYYYHNDYAYLELQACPAVNSRIYNFIRTSIGLFLLSSFADLAVGGGIARVYAALGRNAEAVCMGHLFMGMMGHVFAFSVNFFLMANSIYGTYTLVKAGDTITTELDPRHPEIFCNAKILYTAYATATLGFIRFVGMISYLIFYCVKNYRSSAEDGGIQLRRALRPRQIKWRAPIDKDPTVVARINPADLVRPEDFINFPELDDFSDGDNKEEEEPADVDADEDVDDDEEVDDEDEDGDDVDDVDGEDEEEEPADDDEDGDGEEED